MPSTSYNASILLIDPREPSARHSLRILCKAGVRHRVQRLRTCAEALHYIFTDALHIATRECTPQLVLVDSELPPLEVSTLICRVKRHPHARRICVVLMIGANAPWQARQYEEFKPDACLPKPFDVGAFKQLILALLYRPETCAAQ